jgi:hypothetical protein
MGTSSKSASRIIHLSEVRLERDDMGWEKIVKKRKWK